VGVNELVDKPLCIDLFCGLGGWAEGFLSQGYDVVGFDIERHDYGTGGYPGQLVLQDVLTLDGRQFAGAACIVASPPCQAYSYMAMPWRRAKTEAAWQRWFRDSGSRFADPFTLNYLFDACFRIQREASEAAGRPIPLVVENVKGAQPWVGRAKWHYGSYYLWGDVPALMPWTGRRKNSGGSWFSFENGGQPAARNDPRYQEQKNGGGSRFGVAHNTESGVGQNPVNHCSGEAVKVSGDWFGSYAEQKAAGTISPGRLYGKHSPARKAASAQIAKIPFPLAEWIAWCFKP